MRFLLNEVLDYPAHYAKLSNGSEATPDLVAAILEGAATLCQEVLAPLNLSGDQEGCHFRVTVMSLLPPDSRKPTTSLSKGAGRAFPSR